MANNKGQALVESLLALPLLCAGFCALLFLTYWGGVYFYSSYKLEEALLCAASPDKSYSCQQDLETALGQSLLFRERLQVHLAKSSRQVRGVVEIELPVLRGMHLPFRQEQSLRLPLEDNLL